MKSIRAPGHITLGAVHRGIALGLALSCAASAQPLQDGKGSFIFRTPQGGKDIRVWYYRPISFHNKSQIVFVMHGVKRNGETYRNTWIRHAREGRFLLLVPEFSSEDYPDSVGYHLGNMFSSSGRRNNEASWSFTVIEDLFDHVKATTGNQAVAYDLYGHSAGAQFVHRLVMFLPNARIRIAIAANAGWYTMPTRDVVFPYGLKDSGTEMSDVGVSFEKNVIILLGAQDTDKNHKHLRKTTGAMAQGAHRLARGQRFYQMAKTAAKKQKIQLKWKRMIVPDVGHSHSKMSVHAARLLR